ncbi:MAG: hypothetical protein CSB48_11485 [Proteobacteria bacterium]|nr:MAG: hypothetical protein CSB48_11485 [Pseudomonadota bacterium]PIE40097.1 MAG: hypothetical protein CSA51_02340 [Gammaproteobacteria bacterium]
MATLTLFGKSKAMERQIDDLFDTISEGGMLFENGVTSFLNNPMPQKVTQEEIDAKMSKMRKVESEGRHLRRSIESDLYTEMLIPDLRGDVLSLLEDTNYILSQFEDCYLAFILERPDIPKQYRGQYQELTATVVRSVDSAVSASRAFFRDISAVRDHTHKVRFFEDEADTVAMKLKRDIFNSSLSLDEKTHLRDFVDKLDSIADEAEEVADWLAIYSIKRSM